MTVPLRIGLLGASRIAAEALVEPARETGDRLVAVAARSRDRAEASEKPFAATGAEAREVRDAAAAAGVRVVVGFHYLHHPLMRRLHAVAASGEIGSPRRPASAPAGRGSTSGPRRTSGTRAVPRAALRAFLRDEAPLPAGAGVDVSVAVAGLVDEAYLAAGLLPRPRHGVPAGR
ncbi:hypothetical protein [Pseudonocardia sp. T1-2H]|uniref:hypothetical protein n=1 Tax=Pseudonocardia sp. T1-2H TaxID=3128899 RepID=UPI003101A9DC